MRVEKLLTCCSCYTLLYFAPPLCRDSTSLNFYSRETCFGGRFNFELTRTSRHDVSKPFLCPLSQRTDFPAKWITSTRFSPLCVSLTPYRGNARIIERKIKILPRATFGLGRGFEKDGLVRDRLPSLTARAFRCGRSLIVAIPRFLRGKPRRIEKGWPPRP